MKKAEDKGYNIMGSSFDLNQRIIDIWTPNIKGGIWKILNDGKIEGIPQENFIITESWRKQRDRLLAQYPNTKVKYSYKTKQFTISWNLPSDFKSITKIDII